MNDITQKMIDSHVHLDHIHEKNPDRIRWMQVRGITPVSWAFAMHIECQRDAEDYLRAQADTIQKLNQQGLECFFLAGIHPRNIPDDLHAEHIGDLLRPFLEHPLCLGIGEIGLETGSPQEKEIFAAQLDLGSELRSMGKRLGIHTPRSDKPAITREILKILESYSELEAITVVDHCIPETIGWVLEKGYWAGVTLSPIKASFSDLEQIIERHPGHLDRIICNTDSGSIFYEDLYDLCQSDIFSPEIRKQLVSENAFRFFRLRRTGS